MRRALRLILTGVVWLLAVTASEGAELQTRTIEAFDRYVAATEKRIDDEISRRQPFLWLDRLGGENRGRVLERLRAGEVVVEPLQTLAGGGDIEIPGGMVHHWVGTVLIPRVSLDETLAMVQDYDRYADIYAPNVRKAKILDRSGGRFRVYAQLFMKKVVTVVLDTEYNADFVVVDERRAHVPSRTTRIVELENVGTPDERGRLEGNDRGFLWRFNNYCSFEERTEGTYMQCESVSLSRGIPLLLGLLVRPFVTGVPRESMTFTLEAARRRLTE